MSALGGFFIMLGLFALGYDLCKAAKIIEDALARAAIIRATGATP